MGHEQIALFTRKRREFYYVSVIFASMLITASLAGMFWLSGNNQRTIFGSRLKVLEKSLAADKKAIEAVATSTVKEEALKASALKYLQLNLTHKFMLRQLLDFGFFVFWFWSGIFMLAMTVAHNRFAKKFEDLLKR